MSTQYKLDTVLSAGHTVTRIDKTSAFMELTFWWGIWSVTEYFFFFSILDCSSAIREVNRVMSVARGCYF